MDNIVYINGIYTEARNATISIFDRGVLFGDSVYEVIPVYNGHPWFVDKHLDRLKSSLEKIKIQAPQLDWPTIFKELVHRNGDGDLQIYLQITRGVQSIRKPDLPENIKPSIFAFTIHTPYTSDEDKRHGLHACVVDDFRWLRCDIKTTAMLGNILINDQAITAGAQIAILSRDGFLTEGSASNVFIVDSNGIIKTPPLSHLCLPGITRQLTIELIHKLSLPFREETIPIADVFSAREIMITSTTKEIYPVTQLNGNPIANGQGGACWELLNANFHTIVESCYE